MPRAVALFEKGAKAIARGKNAVHPEKKKFLKSTAKSRKLSGATKILVVKKLVIPETRLCTALASSLEVAVANAAVMALKASREEIMIPHPKLTRSGLGIVSASAMKL